MRLAMIITTVDQDDSVYGANIPWIRALADRVDHLTVIGMSVGRYDLPANTTVYSMGKERGASRLKRLFNLQRIMLPLMLRRRVQGVFVHQGQIWGPALFYAQFLRIPIILFKAHGKLPASMRFFLPFFNRVTTTTPDTFPLDTRKKVVVGQGVDTRRFSRIRQKEPASPRIVSSGRLSAVKGYDILLAALSRLEPGPAVDIYGEAYSPHDRAYAQALKEQTCNLGLGHVICFQGGIPHAEMPEALSRATLFVNASTGASALDKSVLEAMACELPVISCNPKFRELFGSHADLLYCPPSDGTALATAIQNVLALDPADRYAIGRDLRGRVVQEHDVERLMDRIVKLFRNLVRKPRSNSSDEQGDVR